MVSPFKISRDVAATKNSGATRFADEWHTWRGIAYLHCHHHWPSIDSLQVHGRARTTPAAEQGWLRWLRWLCWLCWLQRMPKLAAPLCVSPRTCHPLRG